MFSQFVEAINQRASSVLQDGVQPMSSSSSTSTPVAKPSTPRTSLGGDPTSPPRPNVQADGNGANPGYSTYQRRAKPSLEDRLRASLAAKEKRDLESRMSPSSPSTAPTSSFASPIATRGANAGNLNWNGDEAASRDGNSVRSLDISEKEPWKIPLPASPTLEAHILPPVPEILEIAAPEAPQPPLETSINVVSPQEKPELPNTPSGPNEDAVTLEPAPEIPSKEPLLLNKHTDLLVPLISPAPSGSKDHTVNPLLARQRTPSPPPPVSKYDYDDPLTPAFKELEREQKAAAARSLRSPSSPSHPPPTPKKHQATRSTASISLVPEGEPFVRLHSRTDSFPIGHLGAFNSIEGMEGINDTEGVKDFIRRLQETLEASQEQMTRLNSKLAQQDSRIEELRDMHKLETSSQSELIESLRSKLADTESLISTFQSASSNQADAFDAMKAEMVSLKAENEKNKAVAKDEEEKRTKAISLLKTVRTKLVKAEKERDEVSQELNALRENERGFKERGEDEVLKLRSELERMRNEIERVRSDSIREVTRIKDEGKKDLAKLRSQIDVDASAQRDAMERELLARRGEWEIEMIASKTAHQKELANLNQRLNTVNSSLSAMTDEKAQLFDDLQLRSSECESALTRLEDLQSQTTELNYQLREKDELVAMLQIELSEARRSGSVPGSRATGGGGSAEMARLLSEAESRSEARLSELRTRIKTIEAERHEAEENWSNTLASRGSEIERLRNLLRDKEREWREVSEFRAIKEREVATLEEEVEKLQTELRNVNRNMDDIRREGEVMRENLGSRSFEVNDLKSRLEAANNLVDEYRGKESQLKTTNKTLREELRKVQSSAALLERQRNPGVGYWNVANPRSPINNLGGNHEASSSSPDLSRSGGPATPTVNGSGRPPSVTSTRSSMDGKASTDGQAEEEVNVEYVKNVVLQFLEHKEMRPNLVRILSAILRFSPQETRRLVANI